MIKTIKSSKILTSILKGASIIKSKKKINTFIFDELIDIQRPTRRIGIAKKVRITLRKRSCFCNTISSVAFLRMRKEKKLTMVKKRRKMAILAGLKPSLLRP